MIKVSVLYPGGGNRFDMEYFCRTHIPMVRQTLGAVCQGVLVEAGISGGAPGTPAPFAAAAHLLFDSVEDFHAAFARHGEQLTSDIHEYCDVQPVVQISAPVET